MAIAALTFAARTQAAYWQDSESLWRHAIAATTDNIIAESNLALALHGKGNNPEAMQHFEQSLRINRHQPEVLSSLGVFYLGLGRVEDAFSVLREALELEPRFEDAHYNLGNTYLALGDAPNGFVLFCSWGAATALAHLIRAAQIRTARQSS